MTELVYPLASGAPVVSAQGLQGPRGPGLLFVEIPPTSSLGVDDDVAVDFKGMQYWVRASGSWSAARAMGGALLDAMRAVKAAIEASTDVSSGARAAAVAAAAAAQASAAQAIEALANGQDTLTAARDMLASLSALGAMQYETETIVDMRGRALSYAVAYRSGRVMYGYAPGGDLIDYAGVQTQRDDVGVVTPSGIALASALAGRNRGAMIGWTAEGAPYVAGLVEPDEAPGWDWLMRYRSGAIIAGAPSDGGRMMLRGHEPGVIPELLHIAVHGQSNSLAGEAMPTLSGTSIDGIVTFEMGYQTWLIGAPEATAPATRPAASFGLLPLTQQQVRLTMGETATGTAAMSLKAALFGGRHAPADLGAAAPQILLTCEGQGARYLAEINHEDVSAEGHFATYLDDIARGQSAAAARGWRYRLFAHVLWQGENEVYGVLVPGGATLGFVALRTGYRDKLLASYEQWDAQGRAVTGQTRSQPMFVVLTATGLAVACAQQDAAAAHRDIVVVGPAYRALSALNSYYRGAGGAWTYGAAVHFAADGQRQIGEKLGQAMARKLLAGRRWAPLQIASATRLSATQISVKTRGGSGRVRIDTVDMPPVPACGFRVFAGTEDAIGATLTISTVEVVAADEILITLSGSTPLAAGATARLQYAWSSTLGMAGAPVVSTRAGAPLPVTGLASREVVVAGDILAKINAILRLSVFTIWQGSPISMTVRDAYLEGGDTVLVGDVKGAGGVFVVGQDVEIKWAALLGNICDSDDAEAHLTFGDQNVGGRAGEPYPMVNDLCPFSGAIAT